MNKPPGASPTTPNNMKTLPYYDYTCSYDLDHEITKDVETLKKQVKNLQAKGKKKIIKALIETLLNEL